MKKLFRKLSAFLKGFILFIRPGTYLGFLSSPFLFVSNLLSLSRWISKQQKTKHYTDFFNPSRDHSNRYKLFDHIVKVEGLDKQPVTYLEFGVSRGHSFRWWTKANTNTDSRFYGFDTFEGLPEQWGTYAKGEMAAGIPELNDERCKFYKGLFQETLVDFINEHPLKGRRKIIHLDADLFSATLYVLTTLARDLKKDDILLFDEFNVPNHEWMAYKLFMESFYLKTQLLGAVNNYYQVAFKVID